WSASPTRPTGRPSTACWRPGCPTPPPPGTSARTATGPGTPPTRTATPCATSRRCSSRPGGAGVAQQHPDPPAPWDRPVPADALTGYLRARATEFLRALRRHRETGAGAAGPGGCLEAARALRRSARRISGTLHTFQPLLAPEWSESLRPELAWIAGTLAHEDACAARLDRLLHALQRLSGAPVVPSQAGGGTSGRTAPVRPAQAPAGRPGSNATI